MKTEGKEARGYTARRLTEEEYNALLQKGTQQFPSIRTEGKRTGPEPDLAEFAADVFEIAGPERSVILSSSMQVEYLDPGEKIKVLPADHLHSGAEWLYHASDVTIRFRGVTVQLKRGTPLAVLAPNYREQLRAHEQRT